VPPAGVCEGAGEAVPAASTEITLTPQEPAAPVIVAPVIVAPAPANRSTDSPPQGRAAGAGETIELSSKPPPLPSTRQQRRHDDVPEDAAAASRYVIVEEQPAKPPVMTPQRMRLVGIGAAVVLVIALGGLVLKPSHHASATPASANPATNDSPAAAPTPAVPAAVHRAADDSTDIPVPVMSALPGTAGIKPFRIGQTEITVAQFRQFVQREGYVNPRWTNSPCEAVDAPQASWEQPGYSQTGDFPVVCVSRTDARAYAAWLGRATGNAYRLPTEAEWDYANHAASTPNPDGKTPEPVRSHPANELGLFDTAGNVREWTCSAAGGADAARSCASMSDGGPSVIRGGSWHDGDHRAIQDPDHRDSWTGFRLAQDIK
jgi:formylglycine-generating enzyme required for sulfatase activity